MPISNNDLDSAKGPAPEESEPPHEGFNPPSTHGLMARAVAILHDDRRLRRAMLALMVLIYGPLLGLCLTFRGDHSMTLTFNSMLDHLLRGQFDVDPQIVGIEGYPHNGKVYAYWGILPALFRLPLWIFRRMDLDVTFGSCFVAVCIAAMAKVRAVLLVRRHGVQNRIADWAVVLLLGHILLGGSAIAFLNLNIYQEVIHWSYAFSSVFVYLAIKGLLRRSFETGTLVGMALCAGLAILTRASTGVGLIVTFGLLLTVLAFESASAATETRQLPTQRLARTVINRRFGAPLGVLAILIALTGTVNYLRWGSPTEFVDYSQFCDNCANGALPVLMGGLYDLKRIPFGLIYYFFPAWVFHDSSGRLFMETTQTQVLGGVELPPSSFLLTDLLPLCFIVLLLAALCRLRKTIDPSFARRTTAIAIGLSVPCIMMLSLVWFTHRYRMEFYPEFDFLTILALYFTLRDEQMLARFARYRKQMSVALAIGIVSSFGTLALYHMFSLNGRSTEDLRPGVVQLYSREFVKHYHSVMGRLFKSE